MSLRFLIVFCSIGLPLQRAEAETLTFEKDIRPIFRAHCFDCHGATEDLKGGLDLRLVRFLKKGGDSGSAIDSKNPDESYLLERIRSGEMPPGESRVSQEEIETIAKWLKAGAKTARAEPETLEPGLGVSPEERSFWAFQPIRRPQVKPLNQFPPQSRVRTPVDALLIGEEEFKADADRRTLVIRAYLTLTGLPPAPEQVKKWINDAQDDWYERLLSELFESPHYGEHWARHWLDVAGYADSEGYTTADAERPWVWKYRDWVIRALNSDKPFDKFLTEQLAGDELAGPKQGDWKPAQIELLTATGFLRMAADGTGSGANNPDAQNQVMTDTLKIIGTSLFGLSLQCAQCHDHRYDPIPQSDYYALRAVFEPALDWKAWKVPGSRQVSLYTDADRQKAAAVEEEVKTIQAEKSAKLAEYMQQALDKELTKYEEPLRAKLREAYQTLAGKRTDEQKKLLAENPSVNITPGNLYQYIPDSRPKLAEFDARVAEARKKKPPEEFLRALVEPPNHVPETKLFHRGDYRQPKQTIAPAALTVTSPEGARAIFSSNDTSLPTTGRRLAFARWLTSRDNPLLARVIVNRVWMHHFGEGLVKTPGDFGKLGATPTHPELLDWLADEFIANGWSLKKLHRLILSSTAWRQTRSSGSGTSTDDGNNGFPTRLVRLEAEAIRDRMLAATGQLDPKLFGPPLKIKTDDTGQVVVDGPQTRRSLYIQVRRSLPVAMLQAFDAPVMETNCESRSNSTVATQSLIMLNGEFILEQAALLAERAAKEAVTMELSQLAALPDLPMPKSSNWQYGYGSFDENANRTESFTTLSHWTGSQWQAGANLPDAKLGWVLLHASGGHPDVSERAVIRRWVAPVDGTIAITGKLSHPSPNGDGVRGRIVSSRSGLAGQWEVQKSSADTPISNLAVKAGETIDFLTDCRSNHTSDSFSWPVTITLKTANGENQAISSADNFRGPAESAEALAGQVVRAWQLAYCRPPSSEELRLAMSFVARQIESLEDPARKIPAGRTPARQAMVNLCQTLFSSNEFLYIE